MKRVVVLMIVMASCLPGEEVVQQNPPVVQNKPVWQPSGYLLNMEKLVEGDGLDDGNKIAISPDGKQMAYIYNNEIHILNLENKSLVQQKTNDGVVKTDVAFSPDGSRIIFAAKYSGNQDLYIMPTKGILKTQVTRTREDDFVPAWSPDGKTIAFTVSSDTWWLWFFKPQTNAFIQVRRGGDPAWFPDSKRLVFQNERMVNRWIQGDTEYRDYEETLWYINADGTGLTQLTPPYSKECIKKLKDLNYRDYNNKTYWYFGDYFPDVSPDGKWIVFSGARNCHDDDIWLIKADGTRLTRLTNYPGVDWNPKFGPDGYIYWYSDRSGHMAIWRARIDFSQVGY